MIESESEIEKRGVLFQVEELIGVGDGTFGPSEI